MVVCHFCIRVSSVTRERGGERQSIKRERRVLSILNKYIFACTKQFLMSIRLNHTSIKEFLSSTMAFDGVLNYSSCYDEIDGMSDARLHV